jgi:hypothetical protein
VRSVTRGLEHIPPGYQVGSALGLAAMTALGAAHGADQLGDVAALTDGYSAAFLGAAGLAAVGGLLAAVTLRRPRSASDEAAAEQHDDELVAA